MIFQELSNVLYIMDEISYEEMLEKQIDELNIELTKSEKEIRFLQKELYKVTLKNDELYFVNDKLNRKNIKILKFLDKKGFYMPYENSLFTVKE